AGASNSSSKGSPAGQKDSPDLVHQLPTGASAIVYADVAQLRASAFAKELAALAPTSDEDPQYTAFVNATGFDYSPDLDRAAMALWPHTAPTTVLVFAEGRFDRKKIANYALQTGKLAKEGGLEVYEVPEQGSSRRIRFAFLAPNRLALADGPALDALLKPTSANNLDPVMSARVAQVSGAAIFSVARTENLTQDIGIDESHDAQLARMLKSIRSISLAGQPNATNFSIAANAECDSSLDALQLMTVLDGLRWMGRAELADPKVQQQIGPQWRPLDELLKATSLTHSGHTLRLRAQLTEQMLAIASGSPPATPTRQ
ncbi:MAG TPA: hypothetical protein VEU11_05675, partial [Terriglobales bacterium]|nr:hypothetical protein [Terriglobales bacterium]